MAYSFDFFPFEYDLFNDMIDFVALYAVLSPYRDYHDPGTISFSYYHVRQNRNHLGFTLRSRRCPNQECRDMITNRRHCSFQPQHAAGNAESNFDSDSGQPTVFLECVLALGF